MLTDKDPLLRIEGLNKSYNVPVLQHFNIELEKGEVHALVGGNGAGKSTFARILSGLLAPDSGVMTLDGKTFAPKDKRAAEEAGVTMVLQELNVLGTLTVAENLFLNRLPQRFGFVCYPELRRLARQALERMGLESLDPDTPAARLGVGQQQLIEIAGALTRNCKLLILDEPSAALTAPETELLFKNIRRLQSQGVGILYISHRMDEIRRIADRVTVLRDGRRIGTHAAPATTPAMLVREMVGHDLPERPPDDAPVAGEVALRVCDLHAGERVRGVSFEVRRGEILGIAGLIGSGRTETLRAIFGAERADSGGIFLNGDTQPRLFHEPAEAVRAGLGMVPEDRKQDGLLLPHSIRVNTTLATLRDDACAGLWIDHAAESSTASELCERTRVQCASLEQPIAQLSGGNQQKVIMARWLARNCDVLLFDEPTRGIDAAAKDLIYQLLRDLVREGKALVVVSSELPELMALSRRIAVMSAGQIVEEFSPDEWTQEKLTQAAFRGHLNPILS
jgi:ribose transport system ATP-binding protein